MSDRDRFQESTRDRLRQLTLSGALEDESLDRLAGLSRVVHVPRKTVLFSEGTRYVFLGGARYSLMILGGWGAVWYALIFVTLVRKQVGQ